MSKRGHYTERLKPGEKFGRLTVVKRVSPPSDFYDYRGRWYLCQCECGKTITTRETSLKQGKTRSCGCLRREKATAMGRSGKSIKPGERFGKLTVIKELDKRDVSGNIMLECKCDCGNTTYAKAYLLRHGRVKSCGCLKMERIKEYWERKRRVDNGN